MGARGRPARVLEVWRGVGSDFGWHRGGVRTPRRGPQVPECTSHFGFGVGGCQAPTAPCPPGQPSRGGQLGAHAADTTSAFLLRIFLGNFFLHTVLSPDPGGGCALALRPATLFWVVAECAAWPLFLPWEPPPPGSAGLWGAPRAGLSPSAPSQPGLPPSLSGGWPWALTEPRWALVLSSGK